MIRKSLVYTKDNKIVILNKSYLSKGERRFVTVRHAGRTGHGKTGQVAIHT